MFIFTHNGLFASWVGDLLPGIPRKAITGWSLDGGARLGDMRLAAQRVRDSIRTSASSKELAQAMMTLMDEFLFEARFAYELAVPARRGEQYTLSELWDPFRKRLGDLEKALATPLGDVQALIAELVDLPKLRNQLGAHENEFAKEFPLSAMRDYCEKSLALFGRLYRANCCSFAEASPDRKRPLAVVCRCRAVSYVNPALTAGQQAVADAR